MSTRPESPRNGQRYLKPARSGLIVRRPESGTPLPDEGAWVTWNSYWLRRMREGSVVEGKPSRASAPGNAKQRAKAQTAIQTTETGKVETQES